ncbi:MAG: arylsulfatase [Pirellulaceae bacterium]|nr:arylsulfatase [Pirellulaceae bacterium]
MTTSKQPIPSDQGHCSSNEIYGRLMAGWLWFLSVGVITAGTSAATEFKPPPNVVLVMIDDMGYGDIGCHGSPFIATPSLDRLHSSSIRLTNFHAAPMCSPTRGQLLTGLDAMRNGSSIVASSRMLVRRDIPLLPQYLQAAGYATGIFGKWHLGENYPHRPQDRGFQRVLTFGLQEIGSIADYWCNDYFDPTLRTHTDQLQQFSGYCSDIFFEQAMSWMREQLSAERPFFCYIPLNVVHGPQWAPRHMRESIRPQFPQLTEGQIGYLAMLANVDLNMGRLEKFLQSTGSMEDTLVIFLSDNGGYALIDHYNAGMRGGKSRMTEGGHRVPCFVRWPAGGLGGDGQGRDFQGLTQVQDLLPTILELCAAQPLEECHFDGISLVQSLRFQGDAPERTLIVQYGLPEPFRMTCVLQGSWRLLSDIRGLAEGGPELYDLDRDPRQQNNLIDDYPEKAAELRAAYDRWWSEVEPLTRMRSRVVVGNPAQELVMLSSAEWRDGALSSLERVRKGDVKRKGIWDIEFDRNATYEFQLRRWPLESGLALGAAAPTWTPSDAQTPDHAGYESGAALPIASATLRLGDQAHRIPVELDQCAALVQLDCQAGPSQLQAYFEDAKGQLLSPVFYLSIRRIE